MLATKRFDRAPRARSHLRWLAFAAVVAVGLATSGGAAAGTESSAGHGYEVWAIDQAVDAGVLYIYEGSSLNKRPAEAVPEVHDLGETASPLCLEQTGSAPVRAHMLGLNSTQTHAILANVATGHVVFIETATRHPVACIDVGVQAHAAFASPDDRYVYVANQNGKLFQRISTDYATNTFVLEDAATLNLATCTTPNGDPCESPELRPDNAPICPVIDSSSRFVFVTLRGGGLFVLDGQATPMRIVAEYNMGVVRPNGCVGFEANGRMYINSGGGTASNPTNEDLYSFDLSGFPISGSNEPNLPAPNVLFDLEGDSHGGIGIPLSRNRYLWVADRMDNEVQVIDTRHDIWVNTFSLVSDISPDPAPDLMGISPNGKFVYMALRGPCPVTGNAPAANNAVGATPGVAVVRVRQRGLSGEVVGVAPISNPHPDPPFVCATVGGTPELTERADIHTLVVVNRQGSPAS